MAIDKIKLPDGTEIELGEWLHWPTYSTVEGEGGLNAAADPQNLGHGASIDLRLFTYVVGGQIPQARDGGSLTPRQANENDTNQVARARVNHDEAMLVFSMTYEVFAIESDNGTTIPGLPNNVQGAAPALIGSNLRRLQRDCMFELYVGARIQKPQARAPLSYYGQGMGAVAFSPGDQLNTAPNVTNLNYGTGGMPASYNQRRWQLPIYVHSDRVMYGRLWSPPGQVTGLNQNWQFKGYLDGLKRRPVA